MHVNTRNLTQVPIYTHLFILLVTLFLCSCEPGTIKHKEVVSEEDISNKRCFSAHDTTFSNGYRIRYVIINERWWVELKIDNVIDTFHDFFQCPVADGAIPIFFKITNKCIFLKQGNGFNYRNIISCSLVGDKIKESEFESDIAERDAKDLFVYMDVLNMNGRLILYDRDTEKEKIISLEGLNFNNEIKWSEVYKDSLVVTFVNDSSITLYWNNIK